MSSSGPAHLLWCAGTGARSASCGEQGGVPVQVERPSGVVGDSVTDGLPAVAVPVEVAVLELDAGALRGLGDELHLDLAGVVRIRLDLPLRADVPAEHDAGGRFVGEDGRPPALAAVGAAVGDVAAELRVEHGLG